MKSLTGRLGHRCRLTTVVWGEPHIEYLLKYNIPTMLAPGNLPAFVSEIETSYVIYTTARDRAALNSSLAFRRLAEMVAVEFHLIEDTEIANPIETHHRFWQKEIRRAAAALEFVFLLPPDVIWSEGSFRHIAEMILRGKEVIFICMSMRAVAETFLPDFSRQYQRGAGMPIAVPPRELVRLSLSHLHPMVAAYLYSSQTFPDHAEFVAWPIEGEGLLLRQLALVPIVFKPDRHQLSEQDLLKSLPDPGVVSFVSSSDDAYIVSLTALGKDNVWYSSSQAFNPRRIAEWWLTYPSPVNHILAGQSFQVHFSERSEKWDLKENHVDAVIGGIMAALLLRQLIDAAQKHGCNRFAEFLAYFYETSCSRGIMADDESFTFLMPNDEVFEAVLSAKIRLLRQNDYDALMSLVRCHYISGTRLWSGQHNNQLRRTNDDLCQNYVIATDIKKYSDFLYHACQSKSDLGEVLIEASHLPS